jgi:hypothetical protein
MSDLIHDFAHVPLANETRLALEALTLHELNVLNRQLEENEEATEAHYPVRSWDFLQLCLYNHCHDRDEILDPTGTRLLSTEAGNNLPTATPRAADPYHAYGTASTRLRAYFLVGVEKAQRTQNRTTPSSAQCLWPIYAACYAEDGGSTHAQLLVLRSIHMDGKVSVDLDSHKVCQLKDCALLQYIEDGFMESEGGLEDWLAGEMKRFEDLYLLKKRG